MNQPPVAIEIPAELSPLDDLSDAQLRSIVNVTAIQLKDNSHLEELSPHNKSGKLTEHEAIAFDHLIQHAEELIVLRSAALVTLKQRGYDINIYLRFPKHSQ